MSILVGSEGMLAVITEVVVKLVPKPQLAQVIMASFDDVEKGGADQPCALGVEGGEPAIDIVVAAAARGEDEISEEDGFFLQDGKEAAALVDVHAASFTGGASKINPVSIAALVRRSHRGEWIGPAQGVKRHGSAMRALACGGAAVA